MVITMNSKYKSMIRRDKWNDDVHERAARGARDDEHRAGPLSGHGNALVQLATITVFIAALFHGIPDASAQQYAPYQQHTGKAVTCSADGCIDAGPGCDVTSVPGQCTFPYALATSLCSAHPQCLAVTCNSARNDCQARSHTTLVDWPGFTSYTQPPGAYSGMAVNCHPILGCINSGPGCNTTSVPGQCSFPKASAVDLCKQHPLCQAVNCNSTRNDCQARRWKALSPWPVMNAHIIEPACITAYEAMNYGGVARVHCNGFDPIVASNDKYTSYRVPSGVYLRTYENANGTGLARTYFEDAPNIGVLYNDRASSLRVGRMASDDFVMVTMSDTQLSWTNCEANPARPECTAEQAFFPGGTSEETIGNAYNDNMANQVRNIKAYFGESRFGGLIVNGDLTEYGDQSPDLADYIRIYDQGLDLNVYPGLGNHDYENNITSGCGEMRCVTSMLRYFKDQVTSLNPWFFDFLEYDGYEFPSIRRYYDGSFGYSWNIGEVHFVQLNNHPGYTNSFAAYDWAQALTYDVDITSSLGPLGWLEDDLIDARDAGKTIVLNLHDWGTASANTEFMNLIKSYPVSAVFAGHLHFTAGVQEDVPYNGGGTIPVLLSGSANFGTYLVTRYTGNLMQVWRLRFDHFTGMLYVFRNGTDVAVSNYASVFNGAPTAQFVVR